MNTIRTNICRWGNSRGVRLPKMVLDMAGLHDDDEVTLTVSGDSIVIQRAEKAEQRRYPSLSERFSEYTGDDKPEEWDVGNAAGKEI